MKYIIVVLMVLALFSPLAYSDDYSGAASNAELDHMAGVTSNVQDQLDAKLDSDGDGSSLTGVVAASMNIDDITVN